MALNDTEFRDPEYEAAFNDGEPGGMDLEAAEEREEGGADSPAEEAAEAAETVATPEGEPAAVVIVAEVDAGAGKEVKPSAAAPKQPTEAEVEAKAQAAGKDGKQTGDQRDEQQAKAVTPQGEDEVDSPAEQQAGDPDDLSDVPPEDLQKAKSWLGRLKKMEADLKAREAAMAKPAAAPAAGEEGAEQAADAIQQAADQAGAAGNTEQAQSVAEVAQQVKDGEITPEEAMKILAEDFGDDFVRMVSAVAKSSVGKPAAATEELEQTKAELQALRDQATRDHFEAIADAHPDFVQVYEDPAFRKWAHENGKDQIVEAGSARQINKMLDAYKKAAAPAAKTEAAAAQAPAPAVAKPAPAKVDPAAVDAAEGVRSTGLRVPDKPQRANDDFASAWNEF